MRRLALMIACGALWLVLAAVPALADGGPHVKDVNTGSLGLNADGCAGCHRAHTAQGPFLINAVDETALCKTCHGAVATGSTVDVMTGVQYSLRGGAGVGGTQLGALRGGGFDEARIDASTIKDGSGVITAGPSRLTYQRTSTAKSQRPKVGVGAAEPVRSSHLALTENGLVNPGIAWGNGAAGSGAGPAVELSCASCHNPHGNGQYRILNPLKPETPDTNGINETWTVNIRASYPAAVTGPPAFLDNNIYTVVSHALQVGDQITIAGHTGSTPSLNGTWFVKTIGDGTLGQASSGTNNFSIAATLADTAVDVTVAGTGGTVTRDLGVVVSDPTLPGAGDTRNYTIMQVKGTEGTESTYLLYASQVAAAASGTFYPSAAIASSNASTEVITTTVDHGLAGGDSVTITGHDAVATPAINGTYTVATASTKSFTLTGVDITTGGTAVGRVTKTTGPIPGTYTATGGDYFVRAVPWNPGINNTCDPTVNNATGTQPGCATANSAPNGRPSTFSGQITSWCASCHTRYFANNNPTAFAIASSDATSETITTTLDHGLAVGNTVWITGHDAVATPAINGTYTVATASTKSFTLTGVNITVSGTAVGTVSNLSSGATGASWGNPRPGDNLYKYQHRTVAGRDCLLCHVSHGSNAAMTGTFSSTYLYPDFTTVSDSSRLLKVDNRGTCQVCHDPTETVPTGTYIGPSPVPAVP